MLGLYNVAVGSINEVVALTRFTYKKIYFMASSVSGEDEPNRAL